MKDEGERKDRDSQGGYKADVGVRREEKNKRERKDKEAQGGYKADLGVRGGKG